MSVGEQTVALPPPPPPQPPIVEEHAFRQVTTKRCIENEDTSSDIGDSSTRLEPTQPVGVKWNAFLGLDLLMYRTFPARPLHGAFARVRGDTRGRADDGAQLPSDQ